MACLEALLLPHPTTHCLVPPCTDPHSCRTHRKSPSLETPRPRDLLRQRGPSRPPLSPPPEPAAGKPATALHSNSTRHSSPTKFTPSLLRAQNPEQSESHPSSAPTPHIRSHRKTPEGPHLEVGRPAARLETDPPRTDPPRLGPADAAFPAKLVPPHFRLGPLTSRFSIFSPVPGKGTS